MRCPPPAVPLASESVAGDQQRSKPSAVPASCVADALAFAFEAEVPCDSRTASILAALARRRLPEITGSDDDTDADLVLRLRDPRVLGSFVEALLGDGRVPEAARLGLVEHLFDLLPLPRTEGEVIAVESRAPPHLLTLAVALADSTGLTVLHVMHLVYAVFLDRSLLTSVSAETRSRVLQAIVAERESSETLRALYAGMHLSMVPEREAARELRRILDDPGLSGTLRRTLAALAASDDGGHASLADLSQVEGLVPPARRDREDVLLLANIPRLPQRLKGIGERHLRHHE